VIGFSTPFILRPVGTTLMAVGLFLIGAVAYMFLPVSSLPAVEYPVVVVNASRPGADPITMAASVAAPLERTLGAISGVNELTSTSSLGTTRIIIQFDLARSIDDAARDVQAALNAAATDLPSDLPSLPSFRKANPNASPVLILALTSDTMTSDAIYDVADTVIAQRIAQVEGVGDVNVAGAEQPAIRIRLDPARLAAMGLSLEQVRQAVVAANAPAPLGSFDGARKAETIAARQQIDLPRDYRNVVVRAANGTIVRLGDVAEVVRGVRNTRAAGWFNHKPAVLLTITKQPDANVIKTVEGVKALLPELKRWIPAGIDVAVMSDRTVTIRASVEEVQQALTISICLVMLVVFLFLRRATPTIAAGITVPLSLAGTCAAMWASGFTLDNLSLMALTIAVGFVVDDAIVMIENIHRNMEAGMDRLSAALTGARQIGFTVISISLSLVAAFIPIIFMGGIVGALLREFSLTLSYAIIISAFVSLSVTPMICGRFMRLDAPGRRSRFDRGAEWVLGGALALYRRSLVPVLRHPWLMLVVMLAVLGLTVEMFRAAPKGYFPQDDSGLIIGFTRASPDISFPAMAAAQRQATDIILTDPAVASTASNVGGGSSVNQGRLFVALKDPAERGSTTSQQVIARLRDKLANAVPTIRVFMVPMQDVRAGGRQGTSQFQYTLWSPDIAELNAWVPKVLERLRKAPQLVDVATDRDQGGLQATVVIDRAAAANLGVAIQDIDNALANSFGQRQISTIYSQRNQYRVVMEIKPALQRDPTDLMQVHVPGRDGTAVPLSSIAHVERGTSPLVINHQGQYPAVTISYASAPGVSLEATSQAIREAVAGLHLPDTIHGEFAGDARAAADSAAGQGLLIVVAILAVYIILGVLYESLIHPVTIISTLPSAGLGALIALRVAGSDLTVIALIGIILLIGIVKKNGIMMVDFAIAAERGGLKPAEAILEASLARFRPILMTTLAALFGALPLALAMGPGAELRRPLGITIVGGLLLSQVLTLYTTPVIYLLMDKLRRRPAEEPPLAAGSHAS